MRRFKIWKGALLSLVIICFYSMVSAQGKVIEQAKVPSQILKHDVSYSIYLPQDYSFSERSYPVVYLLHGYTDDNTAWLQFGEINRYADKGIAEGTIPPMIIITPDADSTWYINSYDGKENFEDFFIKEFIPAMEKSYRIKPDRRFRGVAGLSMGGYGTLIYAMKYPELFSACAPLSAAVFTEDDMENMPEVNYSRTFAQLFGRNLTGKARLTEAWKKNSILQLVNDKSVDDLKKVRYWIDCGDDDFLTKGNCLLHIALTEKKVPHEYRVRDGAHTWTYWRTGITDALQFIGESFH